jgi:hypothetical protein
MTSEPDEDTVLVCSRVADVPTTHVPSRVGSCSLCGAKVWVALSSPFAQARWCARCATDEMPDGVEFEEITEAQRADVVAYRKRRMS